MDTTDLGARHVLSIPDQEKLEFSAGIDAAQIWVDQFRRRANKLKEKISNLTIRKKVPKNS